MSMSCSRPICSAFFGAGSVEEKGRLTLRAGQTYEVYMEVMNVRGPADGDEEESLIFGGAGVRFGGAEILEPQTAIAEAVSLAESADVAIVVVGLNSDWETESWDRTSLALPGLTDELVERIGKVNKNTVVVNQSVSS
jgi:beta-glucosidase